MRPWFDSAHHDSDTYSLWQEGEDCRGRQISTSAPFSTESVKGGRPRPPSAWYTKRYDAADGAQSISPDMFDQLMQKVRGVAGVLGRTCP